MSVHRFIEVQKEANDLLNLHGLYEQGWRFRFSNTKRIIGRCFHHEKMIEYSKHYMDSEPEQVTDTLLHEIAHALVGPVHGHDRVWRSMCIRIGADPNRTPDEEKSAQLVNSAKPNYRIKCEDCGWHIDRYRFRKSFYLDKSRDKWCPRCHSRNLGFYRLNWSK